MSHLISLLTLHRVGVATANPTSQGVIYPSALLEGRLQRVKELETLACLLLHPRLLLPTGSRWRGTMIHLSAASRKRPFLLSASFAASHCRCWGHCWVSHLVLGQRRHLRPPETTWDHLCTWHYLTYILDVWDIAWRPEPKMWWFFFFRKEVKSDTCVHPQECCVNMVTNGLLQENSQPGGSRKGIAGGTTIEKCFLVFEFPTWGGEWIPR